MTKKKSEEMVSKNWEVVLEDFFLKKLPSLPANAKETIVKFGPYIALVVAILSVPTLLMALGIGAMFMPAAYLGGIRYGYGYNIAWWISIASMGLSLWALPGLFKRQLFAWKLMFYSTLVMGVYNLVTMSLGSLVIGTGISLYILFQIKSYYK